MSSQTVAVNGDDPTIDFCTLGMFIIDDIYPPPTAPNKAAQKDIIGGAGTYSALGARLFSPPPLSKSVGWIVDTGTDFPPELVSLINSWDTGVLLPHRPALTTRGWNGYSGNELREFRYLTEKKRLSAEDLTVSLLRARSFHLICNPSRCIQQVEEILTRRQQVFGPDEPRPLFIWEPVPPSCTPSELDNTHEALKFVDVVSPNHDELAALFGFVHPDQIDRKAVEDHAQRLSEREIGSHGNGAVVVRAGASGCLVLTKTMRKWLPALHTDPGRVIDPTGGGNGFLGGLAVGLLRNRLEIIEAARWASVAASFAIEQVGMPQLRRKTNDGTTETWNGVDVLDRLVEYRKRTD